MFAATAQVLEDARASKPPSAKVGNMKQKEVLAAAGTIATVEARPAACIRLIE